MEEEEKIAIVTGAGQGIGRATALLLAQNNYTVFAAARTSTHLETLKAEYPNKIVPVVTDLLEFFNMVDLVALAHKAKSYVDVLVNNLGIYKEDSVLDPQAPDNLIHQLNTNLWPAFYLSRLVADNMIHFQKGHIVNIASVASIQTVAGASTYSISKAAFLGLSHALQSDLKPHNVPVTAILPGAVDTASWKDYQGDRSWMLQPSTIAQAVLNAIENPTGDDVVIRNK